jgi:hypothetical protein
MKLPVLALLGCSSVVSIGCSADGWAPEPERLGAAAQPMVWVNGLAMNGLAMNGLAMNGLVTNGLTVNGLMMTSDIAAILDADPLAQMFMTYVVSCALSADQSVVFPYLAGQADFIFAGGVGVAPGWGADGSACDATCQQWVSSCVIGRVNALGQHIPLSIRGENTGLALAPGEATAYPDREASYFGNVFTNPQQLYACRAAEDDQTLIGRSCGDGADVSQCAIDVLGDCHAVCSILDPTTGAFGDCTTPTGGAFGPASTIYRLPTGTPAPDATCGVGSSAPSLGAAASFLVLGSSTVTSTGATTISGDLGVSPGSAITGFPPGLVLGGAEHAADATALQAQSDLTAAYDVLAGDACGVDLSGQDLGGLTLTQGVYCFSSSAALTGTLVLDAQGDPGAVFVFQIGSTLTTAGDASVVLVNDAQDCLAFWQVGSSATLGAGTVFSGSILALASITLDTGASVSGRALAQNGAVTMDTNTIAAGSCAGCGADAP